MNLRVLTRFTSNAFPEELLTDVSAINDFLRELDAELVGSAKVRKETLEEVRDHLLEHHAALMEKGMSSEQAAHEALGGFGSAKELGVEQRREKRSEFVRNIPVFGLPYAVLMSLFNWLSQGVDQSWVVATVHFFFYFLFFGAAMSAWTTCWNLSAKPTHSLVTKSERDDSALEVYSPKSAKVAAVFLLLGIGAVTLMCVLGLFGVGFMAPNGPILNIFLSALGIKILSAVPQAWSRIRISDDQLTLKTPFRQRVVPLTRVTGFTLIPYRKAFFLPVLGRAYSLTVINDLGEPERVLLTINGEMHNSDQLVALLESKCRGAAEAV
ncbi:permease prefix domain 1-containing protein [Marinimicrobium sp. ABcell2]|uniref:permease prefix domain 1-containing protein n=1 Tax=Marinimicrobium sp. ABcell2 TaxID=3069751 RepID=UPI0027ADE278|nr:permease prefix domain 1-containing protein [Marinimicrobium sp. ABcell2]MDQ2076893.1 permease prefix domain 1-containing protein [Marinimicrobium sp. ABcell2]